MEIILTIQAPDGMKYKRIARWIGLQTEEEVQKYYAHNNFNADGHEIIRVECMKYCIREQKYTGAPLVREKY